VVCEKIISNLERISCEKCNIPIYCSEKCKKKHSNNSYIICGKIINHNSICPNYKISKNELWTPVFIKYNEFKK
jgi:hypothetical protein